MKTILTTFLLTFILLSTNVEAQTKPRYKKVCITKTINNKPVQDCKMIRVHKKLKGTKIPEKKNK